MSRQTDDNLAKTIGAAIKRLRQAKYPNHGGQIKCATDYGVSQAEWSRWERGIKVPSAGNQRKIADFFNVSIAELYGETESQRGVITVFPTDLNGQSEPVLNLYRQASDVQVLLHSLIREAERNTDSVGYVRETLESVNQSLRKRLERDESVI